MARFLRQPAQLARLARQSQQSRIYRGGFHSASRAARLAPSVPRTSLSYNLNTHASATSPLSPLSRRPYSTKGPEPPKNDDKQDDAKKDDSQNQNQNEQPKIQEEDPVDSELEKKRKEWPLPEGWIYLNEEELKVIQDFGKLAKLPGWMKDDVTSSVEAIKVVGAPVELRELIEDRRVKSTPPTMMEIGRIMRIMHKMASKLAEYESVMAFKEDKAKSDTENVSEKEESRQEKESSGSEKSSENKRERRKSESGGSGSGGKGGGDGGDSGGGNPFTRKWFLGRFSTGDLVMTAIVWAFVESLIGGSFFKQTKEITWQEAHKNLLSKGLIKKLTVLSSGRVRIELNQDAGSGIDGLDPNVDYYFSIGSVEAFEKKLEEAQSQLGIPLAERIPVNYAQETGMWPIVMAFGPTLLLVGLLMYTTRQMGGGRGGNQMFGFGKSKAKMFNHESAVKVKFADVAGMDEAKAEIMEFVSFLKTPERFEKLGAKIPRGAILSGPPGTGKTLLAKATAGESGVPFFSVSGSEFVEMFVGVGSSRVRDLFASARKNSPCIIFIDEIDAIGRSRMDNNRPGGNDERETTLNQILTEMDGFNTSEQVVVLAGTNRADILDQALTRPGRFDRHIYIDRPTMKGRQDIFKVHLKKIVTKEELEHLVGRLSTLTPGFSGADIANVVNEAALAAARANASSVELVHFEQAIERVIGGLERKSLVLKPEEKRTVAYHEAGHAICGWFLENADPLLKVSIIPRGKGALGYAQYLPAGDAYLMSVPQLMDRMAMTLGGRISEELHFPTVTTGASDDFRKVTQMARKMVTEWGMSERVGPLHYSEEESSRSFQKPFSESTAQEIDGEVRAIVDKAYARCKELLESRRKEIGLVAEDLLKKEMLTRDDLVRLLGKRPFGDNQEFEKYFGGGGPGDGGSGTGGKSAPPPFPTENVDDPPERPPAPAFREVDGRDVRR